jgi:hypothetical protein
MKDMDFEAVSEVQEIEVLGNRAWCRTHLSVAVTPPNGKPMRRNSPCGARATRCRSCAKRPAADG